MLGNYIKLIETHMTDISDQTMVLFMGIMDKPNYIEVLR
jgi:hypothetical protein